MQSVPRTAAEFMREVKWHPEETDPRRLRRIQAAYGFFTGVPYSYPSELTDGAGGAGSGLKVRLHGRHTGLCAWMQSMTFERDVYRGTLLPGRRLYKYVTAGRGLAARARGDRPQPKEHFYTLDPHPMGLAIYPDQQRRETLVVTRLAVVLFSTVGDALAGWRRDADACLRHGGGVQVFVPMPDRCLEYA